MSIREDYHIDDDGREYATKEEYQILEQQIKELETENTKYAKANEMIREVNKQLKTEVENLEGWRQCPECGAAV